MDDAKVQQLCNKFLESLGQPGFVVFGRQEEGDSWKVTYSLHQMPLKSAVRGMLTVTDQMVQQNLP